MRPVGDILSDINRIWFVLFFFFRDKTVLLVALCNLQISDSFWLNRLE